MIYADYNGTAPCTPEHLAKVTEMILQSDGNPSSIHYQGRRAKVALEKARKSVAWHFSAEPSEIIFMSGATEVNNFILQGTACHHFFPDCMDSSKASVCDFIVSAGEHPSIFAACDLLKKRGQIHLETAPLLPSGEICGTQLLSLLTDKTSLVSLIYVNNETGIKSNLQDLVKEIRLKNPHCHIHIDAVQAFGKVDMTWIGSSGVDSAVVSGHKVGALKGIAALYLKKSVRLGTIIVGGGQERGRRAGTENMPGIFSLGLRSEDLKDFTESIGHIGGLWNALWNELQNIPGINLHGDPSCSAKNTVNFHLSGIPGEILMLKLDAAGIAVSTGSACSSGVPKPSHVLKAMGYSDYEASNSIRISLGSGNSLNDIEAMIKVIRPLAEAKFATSNSSI
jgi:cysteine desulfurase